MGSSVSIAEVRDQLRAKYPSPRIAQTDVVVPEEALKSERAFVIESQKTGHSYITGPVSILGAEEQALLERASDSNPGFMYLQGRFVEADRPNGNRAMWTSNDIALAQPTVAHGPLNWLHDERHIIGAITDSGLVAREAAVDGIGTHIVAQAVIWRFIYQREAAAIQAASDAKQLWYSMECTSRDVTCSGDAGCGDTFPYPDFINKLPSVCSHLRERSSIAVFNEPTFLGGAVVLPPARPGWAQADAQVLRQAAAVTEAASLDDGPLTRSEAEAMVAQILMFAGE